MSARPILFFDSGIGGLTVLREARLKMPQWQFIYVADNAAFPYGDWPKERLQTHIIQLFAELLKRYDPILSIIACNTASTLALKDLRAAFPSYNFVGTVPAIKPAAEQSYSKLISVLATPGTVEREYTQQLIHSYAKDCSVTLVGAKTLAMLAEEYLLRDNVDKNEIKQQILPCFVEKDGRRTDIVVLACTHYPFLINKLRKLAPWPVDWLDPAESIAAHAKALLFSLGEDAIANQLGQDTAYFTSNNIPFSTKRLLQAFGLH